MDRIWMTRLHRAVEAFIEVATVRFANLQVLLRDCRNDLARCLDYANVAMLDGRALKSRLCCWVAGYNRFFAGALGNIFSFSFFMKSVALLFRKKWFLN